MQAKKLLIDSCRAINIEISDRQVEQFFKYHELLVEWNKKINLTGITQINEVVIKHFVDSIALNTYTSLDDKTVIDVGTGAGFPGIPLKIINPDMDLTLLDSLNKRIVFLNEVVDQLGLTGVECIHGRAEDIAKQEEYREKYDICASRAVAHLSILSEYCLPFVRVDGEFISLKGPGVYDEIKDAENAINILGGNIKDVKNLQIPNTDLQHNLVIIKKIDCSPLKYPRKPSKIKKRPL